MGERIVCQLIQRVKTEKRISVVSGSQGSMTNRVSSKVVDKDILPPLVAIIWDILFLRPQLTLDWGLDKGLVCSEYREGEKSTLVDM